MARPRTYKSRGVVLKNAPLGEADRIVTLYTLDLGKVRGIARGARRTKSRLGGHLEPLTHVRFSVAEGRSLDTITEAETIDSFRRLREDLQRITRGVYLVELVDRFTVDQAPGPTLFELLLDTLRRLQDAGNPATLLRHFEVQLLVQSGFGPELVKCVECRSVVEPGDHLFSCAGGGVVCPRCRTVSQEVVLPLSLGSMKVLRYLQRESHSKAVTLRVQAALMSEVESVLRSYIRFVLDREVNSAAFMGLASLVGR